MPFLCPGFLSPAPALGFLPNPGFPQTNEQKKK